MKKYLVINSGTVVDYQHLKNSPRNRARSENLNSRHCAAATLGCASQQQDVGLVKHQEVLLTPRGRTTFWWLLLRGKNLLYLMVTTSELCEPQTREFENQEV